MDVTKSNFKELKPQIEDAIRNCCFAAIDCEFTGLALPEPLHPCDTVAQRYQKLRAGISEYLVVQFGLSLWRFDELSQSYNVKTFNVFTFPDGRNQQRFSNQASCLQFLVQHDFDLNRCVREGLPFLHPQEFEEQRKRLKGRQVAELAALLDLDETIVEKFAGRGTITLSDLENSYPLPASPAKNNIIAMDVTVRNYIHSVWTVVNHWMMSKSFDQEPLLLTACNEFVRMTVYRHIEQKFYDQKFQMEAVRPEGSDHRGSKLIKLTRCETSPVQRLLQKHREELDSLDERFGISSVLTTLANSHKPVVGHNSMRDLLHVIQQFIAPLPEDFTEFQAMCKEIFPTLFDTKHMSVTGSIKSSIRGTRLVDVFNQIKNQHDKVFPMPRVRNEEGFGYDDTTREHEAGFDAWLTGYIFAAFAHSVAPSKKSVFRQLNFSHDSFRPHVNKMAFGPSLDILTIELDISPAAVNRNDVYIIEWKEPEDHAEARYLLSRIGGAKRCGYGEQLLAFVPANAESCVKLIRAQDNSVSQACRLYKYNLSKQNRRRKAKSKSPPNNASDAAATLDANAVASAASPRMAAIRTTTTTTATATSTLNSSLHSQTKVRSPQLIHRSPVLGVGSDLPKKPKLESITERGVTNPSVHQQSGPFPEASW